MRESSYVVCGSRQRTRQTLPNNFVSVPQRAAMHMKLQNRGTECSAETHRFTTNICASWNTTCRNVKCRVGWGWDWSAPYPKSRYLRSRRKGGKLISAKLLRYSARILHFLSELDTSRGVISENLKGKGGKLNQHKNFICDYIIAYKVGGGGKKWSRHTFGKPGAASKGMGMKLPPLPDSKWGPWIQGWGWYSHLRSGLSTTEFALSECTYATEAIPAELRHHSYIGITLKRRQSLNQLKRFLCVGTPPPGIMVTLSTEATIVASIPQAGQHSYVGQGVDFSHLDWLSYVNLTFKHRPGLSHTSSPNEN